MGMWQVYSNLSGGGVPVIPPTPGYVSGTWASLSYLGCFGRHNIQGIASSFPGCSFDMHNTISVVNYNNLGDTLCQLSFSISTSGTYPLGSFVFDVEDISVPTESHNYWENYPPYTNLPPTGTSWGTQGSFAEVILWSVGHSDNLLTWQQNAGGWYYVDWSDGTSNDFQLMSSGGFYSRRLIRMPKFNIPHNFTGNMYFRFYNNFQNNTNGVIKWYLHNLYWRLDSDNTDYLIWSFV